MELAELEKRRDELIKIVQAQTAKAEEIKTAALINRGRLEEILMQITVEHATGPRLVEGDE